MHLELVPGGEDRHAQGAIDFDVGVALAGEESDLVAGEILPFLDDHAACFYILAPKAHIGLWCDLGGENDALSRKLHILQGHHSFAPLGKLGAGHDLDGAARGECRIALVSGHDGSDDLHLLAGIFESDGISIHSGVVERGQIDPGAVFSSADMSQRLFDTERLFGSFGSDLVDELQSLRHSYRHTLSFGII